MKEPGEQWADFANRITFLIDPAGTIAKRYTVQDVKTHPDTVLTDLRAAAGR